MKKLILILTALLLSSGAVFAQLEKPIKWAYGFKKLSGNEVEIQLRASLQPGWHIYSQHLKPGGPPKTIITFKPSTQYTLVGKTVEPTATKYYDKNFKMEVSYFANQVIFKQKVKLKGTTGAVTGTIEYSVCDESRCLPPDEINFTVQVK